MATSATSGSSSAAATSTTAPLVVTRHAKIVLLGDTSVGKSCLVTQFVRSEYHEFQEPTIGAAFLTQTLQLEDEVIKLEIWDTAGQERYRSLAPMYYRGAQAAIVVFDVTSAESFAGAKSWVKELQRRGEANVVIALAANKIDAPGRVVENAEARAFAEENGIIFFETSAKTAVNVRELFLAVARKLPKTAAVDVAAGSRVNLPSAGANDGTGASSGVGCC